VKQVQDWGDSRNKGFCVYCGGKDETRDHAPSKVFLDEPLPANLPLVPSCKACNGGFALHEEYLACLLECVVSRTSEVERLPRERVRRTLEYSRGLHERLRRARQEEEQTLVWDFDAERVRIVLLKLARGHAAFELNEPQLDEPDVFWFKPLGLMKEEERLSFFDETSALSGWPEIGSRAFNRLFIAGEEAWQEGWLVVQEHRYRYLVTQEYGLRVWLVLRDYLACEVVWE
jgi:hypothetical protein